MRLKFLISILIIFISAVWASCYNSDKSWETIYVEQENFFNTNRQCFELAAASLNSTNIRDTALAINDRYLRLSDSLILSLKRLEISSIKVRNTGRDDKALSFLPDKLSTKQSAWSSEKFFMIVIVFDTKDDRNRKGYHWRLEGSEHKHSFGQGGGWFIYSDTDFL